MDLSKYQCVNCQQSGLCAGPNFWRCDACGHQYASVNGIPRLYVESRLGEQDKKLRDYLYDGFLGSYYQQASPYIRKKLLDSIFTGKLIFENGNYRTTGLNEAVALIGLFQQEFGHKKAERLIISDKTFGNVPMTGLEPAPYC